MTCRCGNTWRVSAMEMHERKAEVRACPLCGRQGSALSRVQEAALRQMRTVEHATDENANERDAAQ